MPGTGNVARIASTALWWAATLLTLVILDDLTFGPLFWVISRTIGAGVAVALIFAVYVPVQVWLVARGTAPEPGRVASFFLKRLDVQRRHDGIAERERFLRDRIVGIASAIVMTVLVAGVLPCLVLYRQGYSRHFVLRLSYVTAPIYAAEYALLHGVIPSLI